MKMEEVTSCPICQGQHFTYAFDCTDFTATGELFHVKHCIGCGLGITSPRPPESQVSAYYKSPQYISHAASARGVVDSIYLIIRRFTTRWKYRLVAPYLKIHGLLDYGCGTASFLAEMKKHIPTVYGVEPSADARENIPPGIPVVPALSDLPLQPFDVITLWHVLEHVYPLRETLRQLKQRLSDQGAVFIAVPNHLSPDARHYGAHWAAFDVPRHLWHFNQASMAALLQQEGLRITHTIPMKLDAYYVSLLSERYAHPGQAGIIRMAKALWIGIQSNLRARKSNNYSSLIFVVQK